MCFRASLRGCLILVVSAAFLCHPTIQQALKPPLVIDHNSSHTALYRMNKLLTLPRSSRSAALLTRTLMNFEAARTQMLGQQLRAWEVLDDRVLRAFAETPRENFVPREYRDLAFADVEIPLGHGQHMLAPKVEGRIAQALQVERIDDVLVIGTGSGYLTACLARLAKHVTSVDIFPDFIAAAEPKIAACGIRNVKLQVADALTLSDRERFDAIAVTASVPELDRRFIEMLRTQGRLFVVVGRKPAMEAQLLTLQPDGTTTTTSLFETVLTPLINAERPEPFVL